MRMLLESCGFGTLGIINLMDIDSLFQSCSVDHFHLDPHYSLLCSELSFSPERPLNDFQRADSQLMPPKHQKLVYSGSKENQNEKGKPCDSGGGGRRANNTIFKTGLSQFRKSILDVVKMSPALGLLVGEIKQVCRAKNLGVFLKLLAMVRALRLEDEVLKNWNERKQSLIKRKRAESEQGKFAQKRLAELIQNIAIMDQSLCEKSMQSSLDVYWGHNHRQHQKYQKCKKEVQDFIDSFRIWQAKYQHLSSTNQPMSPDRLDDQIIKESSQ